MKRQSREALPLVFFTAMYYFCIVSEFEYLNI